MKKLILLLMLISVCLVSSFAQVKKEDTSYFFWNYRAGRVVDKYSRPVANAVVTFDGCGELGCITFVTKYARTNTFGYFNIYDLRAYEYLVQIHSKRGTLQPKMVYYWGQPETFVLTNR
jgi:hypothetical protein